jgi:hypothetical protein
MPRIFGLACSKGKSMPDDYYKHIRELMAGVQQAYAERFAHQYPSATPDERAQHLKDGRKEFDENFRELLSNIKKHLSRNGMEDPDAYLNKFRAWHAANNQIIFNPENVTEDDLPNTIEIKGRQIPLESIDRHLRCIADGTQPGFELMRRSTEPEPAPRNNVTRLPIRGNNGDDGPKGSN